MSPSEPCTNETVVDGQTCHTLTFLQASAGGRVKNLKANPWQQKTGFHPPPLFLFRHLRHRKNNLSSSRRFGNSNSGFASGETRRAGLHARNEFPTALF